MKEPLEEVAALQALAFPPPFPSELHWQAEHLRAHLEVFPDGQFVAKVGNRVVASCSNCVIDESNWESHKSWSQTVGGPFIKNHDPSGSTLYGLDITVHPDFRRLGIGRSFYRARFQYVRLNGLTRFGTACRLPDFQNSGLESQEEYVRSVISGELTDRTLTPLLRYGMNFKAILPNYLEDPESGNAAALLEWKP